MPQRRKAVAKSSERTTGVHDDGIVRSEHSVRVSKSEDENTKTFHGFEGSNNPHYTEHSNGSRYRTDSSGEKEKIESDAGGDKPKK